MSNFKEICAVPTDFGVSFTKFKSDKTGLTVVLADVEAPTVNGYFTLATEAFDDFGCPHTLEHLVFLGSEQYPYKGVLDSLANRAFAQGTNAWTDVDHTCYTILTAGSKGFLNLLPIYVDHILYPTLTESGYYTEVHHINGKGENAGVVYSEMQGCQSAGYERLHNRMKQLIYPETCGYRSVTGGLMERLRELSSDQIRDYHKSYYRPDNLCLVITGKVDREELMKTLEEVESSILKKGPLSPMQRPWISTGDFPNLKEHIEETVLFADEDESSGTLMIAWNGPLSNEHFVQKELEVLNAYLTDSSVSVLQKEFVEIEEPLCTDVDFYISDHLKSTLTFTASSVPVEEMENLTTEFFQTLNRLVQDKEIDMTRMATVIEKEILGLLKSAETDAHDTAAAVAISDFLYGSEDGMSLKDSVKDQEYLNTLAGYTAEDWLAVLKKWYIDSPHLILYGKPSAEFAEQQSKEESQRIEKQREDLGPEVLEELQKKLDESTAQNDVAIPKGLLENFAIPPISSIRFIDLITARNNDSNIQNAIQHYVDQDQAKVPLFIQYDHIKSQFVEVSAYISGASIPSHLLLYTRLFLYCIFSLPIEKDGEVVSFEDVVKGLEEDTVSYDAELGTSPYGFKELVVFKLKAKLSNYGRVIEWLKDILWHTQFTTERLKIVATQILGDLPQAKREGYSMAANTMQALELDPSQSLFAASNILYQQEFLQKVLQRLEEEPEKVMDDLNAYRAALCLPENIKLHVSGDILRLASPRASFQVFPCEELKGSWAPIRLAKDTLSAAGQTPGQRGLIVNLPAVESTFSFHSTRGPSEFGDPDIAPTLVMMELLDAMEGIFWKLIRGKGLAYSTRLRESVESGLLYFSVYNSPDAFKAFEQAKWVIEQLGSGEMKIDPSAVDGAKSAVIYGLVNKESTMDSAARLSFESQVLMAMPASYNHDMMSAVQRVTMEDLQRVLNQYFVNMFNAETSNVVVVSTPSKLGDIQEAFQKIGFSMKSIHLSEIKPEGL
ncbi:Metalloenzyme, LuxS/M16 peptidase-like protein [Sporodiniella umbellata]|nr:Metalloenzyme, LuxS/M16 peptidase-like protein [Sporodiniella umbellata]